MECLSKIRFDNTYCLPKCSGIQSSSYDKESIEKNSVLLQNIDFYNSMLLETSKTLYKEINTEHEKQLLIPSRLLAWSKC